MVTGPTCDRCNRRQQPEFETWLDFEPTAYTLQQAVEQGARLVRVIRLVLCRGEPIRAPGRVDVAVRGLKELSRFGRWSDGVAPSVEPAERLGQPEQSLGARR